MASYIIKYNSIHYKIATTGHEIASQLGSYISEIVTANYCSYILCPSFRCYQKSGLILHTYMTSTIVYTQLLHKYTLYICTINVLDQQLASQYTYVALCTCPLAIMIYLYSYITCTCVKCTHLCSTYDTLKLYYTYRYTQTFTETLAFQSTYNH